ncbi:hypothetical protein K1T71_013401 [Dendrolimus kikuchii]|uniref:Uncharacterized protein n=1 Tax=Dendrolimus kikuchii TaxID=765133 RepID=A0ACC1CIC6_9NEOP|nr:hypothetical protein K1T71_013401 [Dendrolimus kikuchii]
MPLSLNLSQFGLVIGFAALLLPQLKASESTIPITDAAGSWIASIPTLALLIGNFTVPTIMAKYGRRTSNLISIIIMGIGWICTVTATSLAVLLIARFLQGTSLGMTTSLSSISIGEYTSPANRGAFLTTLSLMISAGTLLVHAAGSFLPWKSAALVCTCITLADFIIVSLSPESPSWLAEQGRYEECRVVFRWLRGDQEDDEVNKMIEANIVSRKSGDQRSNDRFGRMGNMATLIKTVKKKEFFKPIIIVIHMYILGAASGVNILAAYTTDIIADVTTDINMSIAVVTLDIQRLVSNTIAILLIRRFKRRAVLFISSALNILTIFVIAIYSFLKSIEAYTNTLLGIILINLQMFSITMGPLPLPFIISGELFTLEHRSLSGGISSAFLSVTLFTTMKTFPFLTQTIGLYGAYVIYGGVIIYCLAVVWFLLPETKGKTLQEIEDEFKGQRLNTDDVNTVKSLMPKKY